MTMPQEPRAPGPDRRHAWESGMLRWDVFYLVVFAAVLAIVLVSTPGSTVVAATAIGAMIPWYLLAGRPLWTRSPPARPAREAIYVAGLIALFAAAQSQNPEVWFLAFAITPQFYWFLDTRLALGLGIGLNFLAAALLVVRYPTGSTAATAFGIAAGGGGFAVVFGLWVTRIIRQSAERAEMIDELEATRAELAAAQHEAGRLAERQRLAADIHDTLAQGFTSIVMLIQAAQADLNGSHPTASGHLDLAERTARENLVEARALVADLAPAQLDGSTLPDALRRLSQDSLSKHSLPAHPLSEHSLSQHSLPKHGGAEATFAISGTPRPLPVATEVVLLRVCQEALANVGKHARARSASVRLGYEQDAVLLEVCDDGAGFDPDGVSGGYGLRGMRTRVAEAGGMLTVRSAPGAGTQVSATVPA
jgi:signal transduction histidine kinase